MLLLDLTVRNNGGDAYLLIGVFSSLHTDDLGSGLHTLSVGVLDELWLESRVVLNMSRLINATLDGVSSRLVADLSIGLPKDILALDTLKVTAIA